MVIHERRMTPKNGISDAVKLAIVAGILTLCTTTIGMFQVIKLAQIQAQGQVAAVKTEEVKQALATSTESANQQLTSIHTLVNANMGAQLKISAIALRRIADLTRNPGDISAAIVAEKLLYEHEAKQAMVDKQNANSGIDKEEKERQKQKTNPPPSQ